MTSLPPSSPVLSVRAGIIVIVLALATVALCWMLPPASAGDETGVVMQLPDRVGDRIGFYEPISQAELTILPPDTTFARKSYGNLLQSRLDRIVCSIVLSGKEKSSIHRPERCLPGQGWSVVDSQVINVPLDSGHPLKVTALRLRRPATMPDGTPGVLQAFYLYWYVGRHVSTPYSSVRVLLTNWDLVVHRINQRWAYVIVMKPITEGFDPHGENAEQTLAELKTFIRASASAFIKAEIPTTTTGAHN